MSKSKELTVISKDEQSPSLQHDYIERLNTDPIFSLEVDPLNNYGMSEDEKKFVKAFIEYESVGAACKIVGCNEIVGRQMYYSKSVQNEINRISTALYHRQFATRLISIDEVGGYLTSLLMDRVPTAKRVSTKDKIQIAKMIIDLNTNKADAFKHGPDVLDEKEAEINEKLEKLDVSELKQLLNSKTNDKIESNPVEEDSKEKQKLIKKLKKENNLSDEETAYLNDLSLEEIKKMSEGN